MLPKSPLSVHLPAHANGKATWWRYMPTSVGYCDHSIKKFLFKMLKINICSGYISLYPLFYTFYSLVQLFLWLPRCAQTYVKNEVGIIVYKKKPCQNIPAKTCTRRRRSKPKKSGCWRRMAIFFEFGQNNDCSDGRRYLNGHTPHVYIVCSVVLPTISTHNDYFPWRIKTFEYGLVRPFRYLFTRTVGDGECMVIITDIFFLPVQNLDKHCLLSIIIHSWWHYYYYTTL